jgi:TRAP-type C4-dicarboxylate transport system permease small subunit
MGSIVVIILAQIIFRYAFGSPLFWSEELAKFMFPWLIFSGAALASKTDSHIKIDYFVNKLPERWQSIANRIVQIACVTFCILIILYTIPLAQAQKDVKSTALYIPLNYYSLSAVIGAMGMIFYSIRGKKRE